MPGRLRDPGLSRTGARLDEALRSEVTSQEKAARIANAAARTSRSAVGRSGREAGNDEDRTVAELRRKAAQVGIAGRSTMRKSELISALRHH